MAHLQQHQPRRLRNGNSQVQQGSDREAGFHTRGRYSKKRKKTVLILGIIQMILGLFVIGISFSVFALTSASRIRHASPCWAGFALLFTGGVGVIAWRQPSSLSLGFYTVLSCLCILLHLVATTLAGLGGMELQSITGCIPSLEKESCVCCTSGVACSDSSELLLYAGTTNCHMLGQPALRNIMFANCVTNIVAIILSITTSSVSFILALKRRRTQRILSRGYSNSHHGFMNTSGNCNSIPTGDCQEQFSPIPYLPPPYAPPHYTEISNDPVVMQSEEYAEENAVPNIIIDPGELPPPYSTLDYSQLRSFGRRSRSPWRSRNSQVLENPHSEESSQLSSACSPFSRRSRGCSTQDSPPPPPVRWDSHGVGWNSSPFCIEASPVSHTAAMGRGLMTEYPSQEPSAAQTDHPSNRTSQTEGETLTRQNNLDNPELYITENPLLPLSEAKTPLQIHMATRCENINMYLPSERSVRRSSNPPDERADRNVAKHVDRGRRHSHTGSKTLPSDGTRPKRDSVSSSSSTRVKRRKSRRARSLKSGGSSYVSKQYSSSSDSEEERQRASCPRRKPHKSSSHSDGSSMKECSDCRLPSTSDSTRSRPSHKSKSGTESNSISRESINHSFLCPPRLASSERLTLTDNSSLEERLMALRQSYESLTNSSTQGTLVETSPLRPNSLDLKPQQKIREVNAGSSSPNSEFSNPWILRSRSNTSEGVSFASSSITLTSETSGASNEMKHSNHQDVTSKPDVISMQHGLLPLTVSQNPDNLPWSEMKVPLILDNSELPIKEDNTLRNSINESLQFTLDSVKNGEMGSMEKLRPKSIAEVNHETRVILKQLLLDIESDVELPIKTLLHDIQGMLKSDEHCLVDLQHSANIVNHFLNQKETHKMCKSMEKLHLPVAKCPNTELQDTDLEGLELAKETIL